MADTVASVFPSRIDTLVDKCLDAIGTAHALKGKSGVALTKRCYHRYREIFHRPDFATLAQAGVRPQRPLWASTGSKNPAYSVLYVEPLPGATLAAFREHRRAAASPTTGMVEAQPHVEPLAALGIYLV